MNSVRPFEPYISITTKRYALRTHTLNDKHLPIPRFTVVKSVKHELHKSFNGNCRWFFRNQKGTLPTQHTDNLVTAEEWDWDKGKGLRFLLHILLYCLIFKKWVHITFEIKKKRIALKRQGLCYWLHDLSICHSIKMHLNSYL